MLVGVYCLLGKNVLRGNANLNVFRVLHHLFRIQMFAID